jgi:hypothetical protein
MSPTLRLPSTRERERQAAVRVCEDSLQAARCAARLAAALSGRYEVWEVLQFAGEAISAAERALARLG